VNKKKGNRLKNNAMDQKDRYTYRGCSGLCPSRGGFFEIHVRGHLDSKWLDWLEGLEAKLLDKER